MRYEKEYLHVLHLYNSRGCINSQYAIRYVVANRFIKTAVIVISVVRVFVYHQFSMQKLELVIICCLKRNVIRKKKKKKQEGHNGPCIAPLADT